MPSLSLGTMDAVSDAGGGSWDENFEPRVAFQKKNKDGGDVFMDGELVSSFFVVVFICSAFEFFGISVFSISARLFPIWGFFSFSPFPMRQTPLEWLKPNSLAGMVFSSYIINTESLDETNL